MLLLMSAECEWVCVPHAERWTVGEGQAGPCALYESSTSSGVHAKEAVTASFRKPV